MFGIADKALAILAAVFAVLFLAAAGIQTVRLNGISIFGLYAVQGYIPLYQADELKIPKLTADNAALTSNNATLKNNQGNLQKALNVCNASVDALNAAGVTVTAAAQKLASAARAQQGQVTANIAAMKAIQSTGEKCPTGTAILQRSFQ